MHKCYNCVYCWKFQGGPYLDVEYCSKKAEKIFELVEECEDHTTATEELVKKTKGLSEALNWFIEHGSEDVCKLCVHEDEACKEWQDDIPEDVEPCKFKRRIGNDACFCGIIEFFYNGGVKN